MSEIHRSPLTSRLTIMPAAMAAACALAGPPALAQTTSPELNLARAVASDPEAPSPAEPAARTIKPFADEGHWSWSVGAGVAVGGRRADLYYNGFVSLETFIVKDFQVALEVGGWFFDQDDEGALGLSMNFDFRWHFLHDEERERWSFFAAAGAGILGATEDVPEGSSEFGFTPRIGVGFTWRFAEGPQRLVGGVRWQHISNARIRDTRNNFGSDSAMFFLGVSFPFR